MRAKKLRILVLVLIATMLFGLVACGNNTTPANGDPISGTQRLVVAMPENVVGFDPGNSKGNADNIVAMVQYEALVETDHTGNYSPCLLKNGSPVKMERNGHSTSVMMLLSPMEANLIPMMW